MWKLFIRNKFVEFGNILFSIKESIRHFFTPSNGKYLVYWVGGIVVGYFVLCGIGWLSNFVSYTTIDPVIWYYTYPILGILILYLIGLCAAGTICVLLMLLLLCMVIWNIITNLLIQNVKLAKNGIKVESKWKKVMDE